MLSEGSGPLQWDATRLSSMARTPYDGCEQFAPPAELAERVPCRLLPWAPSNESPWQTLLWPNVPTDLDGQERLGPDWAWHCAPLDEVGWHVPRDDANPPKAYERDKDARG